MYGSILTSRYWDSVTMILMSSWLLSKKEDMKLYGSTNVGKLASSHRINESTIIRIKFTNNVRVIPVFHYRDPKCLRLDNIEGFILNVPTEYKLGFVLLPLKRRHWIALKKIHGAFYNLDSKLDSPQLIGKVVIYI